jgi:hypothetical protein
MPKKIIDTPRIVAPENKPRKSFAKWLWALGGAVVLLGVLVLSVPFFIPWDKVQAEAVAAGSQALGRDLGIGKIDVSLFGGVHIKDLSLANADVKDGFSKQALFTNADAKVDVSLLSLLTGKLVINSITFLKPQVLIETNGKGISNLAGLGGTGTNAAKATAQPTPSVASATVGGKSFPAVLESLVIQDGDIVIRDRQKGTETAVHGLNVKLLNVSLAAAGGSRLEVALVAEVEGKKIPLNLVSNFKLDLGAETVDIKSLDFTAPAVTASLTGEVKNFNAPVVDLKFGANLALDKLNDLLPPSAIAKFPPDLKTQGALKLDIAAQGPLQRPQDMALKGALNFVDINAVYGAYPAVGDLHGTLDFDKAGINLPDLTFKLGGDPITFALNVAWGDLSNLLGPTEKLKAAVRYSIRSPKLNLDPLLAAGSGATTTAATAEPAKTTAEGGLPSYAKSVPKGLSVDGLIDVDSMQVKGFTTGKLTQHLQLKDQKVTSSTELKMYGGRIYEQSRADLAQAGPVFSSNLGVENLIFDKLVDDAVAAMPQSSLAQLKGKVQGVLSVKVQAKGKGFDKPWVLDNTQATIDVQLHDGVIRKLDVMESLASVIPHPQTQQVLRSDIKFSNLVAQLQYASRKVTLKNFQMGSGPDWRQGPVYVQANGAMVLDGPADFKIVPHFNPNVDAIGGDLGKAFQDAKGWPTYDFIEYAGPSLNQAKADFTAGLKKAAGKAVQQQVDRLKKAATDQVQQKAGALIKQAVPGGLPGGLNGLFGK